MPPLPKDPAMRARRNVSSSRATLPAYGPDSEPPPLPASREDWHPHTRAWWADIWRSPMAWEYVKADIHGLFVIAELHHAFWTKPTAAGAAELRLALIGWGLSPMDRRRLEWRIDRDQTEPTPRPVAVAAAASAASSSEVEDPRRVLQMPTKANG